MPVKLTDSPVDTLSVWDREVFIKRDDLLHPHLNGNKARKFYSLFHLPDNSYNRIISYGGHQSNAMLSLAWLSRLKSWRFDYITRTLPSYLKDNSEGNLAEALHLGMNLNAIPHDEYETWTRELYKQTFDEKTLLVRQGGADTYAEEGMKILAEELNRFAVEHAFREINIILSSGTGTSALYLNKYLQSGCNLYAVPCVGSSDYLQQQWSLLESDQTLFPSILESTKKLPFGKPDREVFTVYHTFLDRGVEFDLLYDSVAWLILREHWQAFHEVPLLFIHTGGLSGNPTQLKRYHYHGIA